MTNKTINGVPRDLLERVVQGRPNSAWDAIGDDRLAAAEDLRALLATPDTIVDADGIGEPVDVPVVGKLVPNGGGYDCWHPAANQGQAVVLQTDHAECVAALQSTIAQLKADNERLRGGLSFYAERDHYSIDDGLNWDSCSGEPMNILWHEEQPWFIEDGTVARACLDEVRRMNP